MSKKTILTPDEARGKILAGESLFDVVVTGDLDLAGETIEVVLAICDSSVKGSLGFSEANTKSLILQRTFVERTLFLSGATIEGDLLLNDSIIGDSLQLEQAIITGKINLVTRERIPEIYVSPNMAEIVHWSAPTTPLIIEKEN